MTVFKNKGKNIVKCFQTPKGKCNPSYTSFSSFSQIFAAFYQLWFSVSMVSVCLPSHALLQHLPSYLGFSYLGRGASLHGCSSKAQPVLLTLDEGYLLTAALPGPLTWDSSSRPSCTRAATARRLYSLTSSPLWILFL